MQKEENSFPPPPPPRQEGQPFSRDILQAGLKREKTSAKIASSLRRHGGLVTGALNSDREAIGTIPSQVDSVIIC